MRKIAFAVLCILLPLLCGCSALILKDSVFLSVPHSEAETDITSGDVVRVTNYSDMKNVILSMITQGQNDGVIGTADYIGGTASRDLPKALNEVWRLEPIGAYAVDYTSYDILSRDRFAIYITYLRPHEDIADIQEIGSTKEFTEALTRTLVERGERLTLELYYSENIYDIGNLLSLVYYSMPAFADGMPLCESRLYPDKGFRRIWELTFTYHNNSDVRWRRDAGIKAEELCEELPEDTGERLELLYRRLLANVSYDTESAVRPPEEAAPLLFTAIGAFTDGQALDEGFSLALKWLCDIADIECVVVQGFLGSERHIWNMVNIDGSWYAIDAGTDAREGVGSFLRNSEDMVRYSWNTALYPDLLQPVEAD